MIYRSLRRFHKRPAKRPKTGGVRLVARETRKDIPEREFTDYEARFWKYFGYRLAAELPMKLKGDPGLYARLISVADKTGMEAVQSSRVRTRRCV
jgi:hypothetical protein